MEWKLVYLLRLVLFRIRVLVLCRCFIRNVLLGWNFFRVSELVVVFIGVVLMLFLSRIGMLCRGLCS